MKSILVVAALVIAGVVSSSAQSPAARFESAQYKQNVEGDLEGAIALFKEVAADRASDRALAAKALLRAAQCYEKLGCGEAQVLYGRIVREFADQPEPVAQARVALAKLAPPKAQGQAEMATRRLATFGPKGRLGEPGFAIPMRVASDGRFAYVVMRDARGGSLVRRHLTTGEERTLHAGEALGREPALSLDGVFIAIGLSLPDRRSGLLIVNTESGASRMAGASTETLRPIAWSPDNREVVVDAMTAEVPPRHSLAAVSAQTGEIRSLHRFETRDYRAGSILGAAYSSDGASIVYDWMTEDRERRAISLVPKSGGSPRVIVDGPGNCAVLGFVPRTPELLFLSDRSGSIDAYAVEVRDGAATGARG